VAILPGWLFAGEHIQFIQIIALFIILAGVLFVNIPKYIAYKRQLNKPAMTDLKTPGIKRVLEKSLSKC